MIAYALPAAVIVLAVLLSFGLKRRIPDVSNALRELLLARAEGKLSAEEFEQRQAALHAAVLVPATQKFSLRKVFLTAIFVAAAAGLYYFLGNPKAIDSTPTSPMAVAPPSADEQPAAHAGGDMNEMVKRLSEKLAKDPKNGEGWALLGHSYIELHRHAEAADAFAKAAAIIPADAGMLADWADAYVMSHDRKWDKQSRDIVKRALATDPKHLKALALAGSEAFDRASYKEAIGYWQRMKAVAPADSMDLKLANANIQEATALMTGKPVATAPAAAEPSAASGAAYIAGTLTLSAKLKGKVVGTDTVFVVAKSPDNSGPPLAVKRYTVSDLPIAFRLDDSSAMVPGRNISAFPAVLLSARISKSGNAIPQAGDIQTAPGLVKVGTGNAKLEFAQ